jgi:4-aminobutyrate aminotransferase-like enzyme
VHEHAGRGRAVLPGAPPLVITEEELVRGLSAIDEALTVADGYTA